MLDQQGRVNPFDGAQNHHNKGAQSLSDLSNLKAHVSIEPDDDDDRASTLAMGGGMKIGGVQIPSSAAAAGGGSGAPSAAGTGATNASSALRNDAILAGYDIHAYEKHRAELPRLPMVSNLYYQDQAQEDAYLRNEMKRCFFRANIVHVVGTLITLAVGIDESTATENKNSLLANTMIVVSVCSCVVTLAGVAIVWRFNKRVAQARASHKGQRTDGYDTVDFDGASPSAASQEGPREGEEGSSSSKNSNTKSRSRAGSNGAKQRKDRRHDTHTDTNASDQQHAGRTPADNVLKGSSSSSLSKHTTGLNAEDGASLSCMDRLHVSTPLIHETRCILIAVMLTLSLIFVFQTKQAHCVYTFTSLSHTPDANERCPHHLWWPWFWSGAVWIVIGQPRFMYVAFFCFLNLLLTLSVVRFHDITAGETAVICLILTLQLVFVVTVKWFDEQRGRRRFEAQLQLHERNMEIKERTKQLSQFVQSVTPEYLVNSRLGTMRSTLVSVDRADEGTCVVLQLRNAVSFMQSMMPSDSASILARVNTHCQQKCRSFGLHHLRNLGDHSYFVGNLFREDTPLIATSALHAVRFAMHLWYLAAPFNKLELCCGVGVGEITGFPLGTTCIRYDIFGEALDDAQALCNECAPRRVGIVEKAYMMLKHHFILDNVVCTPESLRETPSNSYKSSPTKKRGSQRTSVGSPSASYPSTASSGAQLPRPRLPGGQAASDTDDDDDDTFGLEVKRYVFLRGLVDVTPKNLVEQLAQPPEALLTVTTSISEPPSTSTRSPASRALRKNSGVTSGSGGNHVKLSADELKKLSKQTSASAMTPSSGPGGLSNSFNNTASMESNTKNRATSDDIEVMSVGSTASTTVSRRSMVLDVEVLSVHSLEVSNGDEMATAEVRTENTLYWKERNLSLESYGFIFHRFADKKLEAAIVAFKRKESARQFLIVDLFFAIMTIFIFCITVQHAENSGSVDSSGGLGDNNFISFTALIVLGLVMFIISAVSVQMHKVVSTPQQSVMFFGCVTVLVAVSIMRPSPTSNQAGYLCVFFPLGSLFTGSSGPVAVIFHVILAVLHQVLGLTLHPLVSRIFFFMIPQMAIFSNTHLLFEKREREMLATTIKILETIREIENQEKVREGVLHAIIPRQLQERMSLEALKTGKIECWSREDCVVLTIVVSPPVMIPSPYAQLNEYARLQAQAARTTDKIEAIVASCTNKSLDIVKVFGRTIMVAGPLDGPEGAAYLHEAVADAMEVVEGMLLEPDLNFTAALVFEQIVNAARFTMFPSFEVLGPAVNMSRCIAGAAPAEMVIATERFTSYYTREVKNAPNPNDATDLGSNDSSIFSTYPTQALAPPLCTISNLTGNSSPTKHRSGSVSPSSIRSPTTASVGGGGGGQTNPPGLRIAPAESWRVRGVGSVRVCRLELNNNAQQQQPGLASIGSNGTSSGNYGAPHELRLQSLSASQQQEGGGVSPRSEKYL